MYFRFRLNKKVLILLINKQLRIMEISERIRIFIKSQKISKKEFLKTIGKSPSYLDNTSNISGNVLATILSKYDILSPDWLLTGRGEMLRSGSVSQRAVGSRGAVHQVATVYNGGSGNGGAACASCTLLAAKEQTIEAQQATIVSQQRMIECLTK